MRNTILQEIISHGDRGVVVPINRLQELKNDFDAIQSLEDLSGFQKFIINHLFSFELPEVDFQIRSILMVATPSPAMTRIFFNHGGRRFPLILPATYIHPNASQNAVEEYLKDFLGQNGCHLKRAANIPYKRLAVRSGLARYGRNNVTYIEGLGSFFILIAFFSDFSVQESVWHEPYILDECTQCSACRNVCPTHAISHERFLIYPDRCLTHMNEADDSGPFPAWVPPAGHNAIVGCGKCQWICPANREHMGRFGQGVEFDEQETALLHEGKSPDQFSPQLWEKLQITELDTYLSALPRNLKVLFDQLELKQVQDERETTQGAFTAAA